MDGPLTRNRTICRTPRNDDMSWRISYWRGSIRLRTTTIEDATQEEIESQLRSLATRQLDHEYLRASEADTPESPDVRSNRSGTLLWTTGSDVHYTAEWFSDDDGHRRKRQR